MKTDYDIVIVGGGPGGLTAGLYGARAELKTVAIERYMPGGQIANTEDIEDYPGFESISGPELAMKMSNHAQKFGLEIITDDVQEVYSKGDIKIVKAAEREVTAKAVILATGGSPNHLKVPGEKEFSGKGVSYCAICDGAFFKGEVIAVVGGGDAAVEEAMFLTKFGSKVILIHRRDELRAQKIIRTRAFANEKLEFLWDSVVEEIKGDTKVRSLSIKNVKTGEISNLDVGAVFIFIGFVPNSNIVSEDVKKDENGYFVTDMNMETSVPGLFAIGDVRVQLVRQITNAVGDGTTAAVAAEKHIERLEDKERGQ